MSVAARIKRRKGRPASRAKAGSDSLGGRIVAARTAAGLDIHQVADRAGISSEIIRMIEQGRRVNPTLDTLRAIAGACGVLVADLVKE